MAYKIDLVDDSSSTAIRDFGKIKNKGGGRLFKNPLLELLTKSSPKITLVNYSLIALFFIWLNSRFGTVHAVGNGLMIMVAGFFSWTLFEYLMHRYIFHWVSDNKAVMKFHHIMHGYHHEYPRDDHHLFMPPLPGWIIASIYLGMFLILFGGAAFVFTAGFVLGYLFYTMMHYATHKIKPPTGFKSLWRHHALHHYKYPNHAFGVSSTIWDHVFRTMPPKED